MFFSLAPQWNGVYFYVRMDADDTLLYVMDQVPDLLFFSGYSLLLQIWYGTGVDWAVVG